MSSIQSEITMYVREQGNVTHNQEKVNRNRRRDDRDGENTKQRL